MSEVSYPRLSARTLRFSLGVPRNVTVSPDGATVRFIRTPDGTTRTGQLWEHDIATGTESVLVDPVALLGRAEEDLSAEERARRERSREGAAGLIGYDVDPTGRWAAFTVSGRLWATHLGTRATRELPAAGPVIDPRLDPTGRRVAYAAGRGLHVAELAGDAHRALIEAEAAETVCWGQAEFIAAEEMDRMRGFWWAPDGRSLLVERYDEAPVPLWHIASPEHPDRPAVEHRYPAAGTANAAVSLWHVTLDGDRTEISWDHTAYEYLGRVTWTAEGPPLIQVLSRDQQRSQVLAVDVETGTTSVLRELADETWVELGPAPRFAPGGRLVTVEDTGGWCRVCVDGAPLSPDGWQVRDVVEVFADAVVVTASSEPTEIQVLRLGLDDASVLPLTEGRAVHGAVIGGGTTVISQACLDDTQVRHLVHRDGAPGPALLGNVAVPLPFTPQVHLLNAGERDLRTAVLLPRDHTPGTPLPVLLDPYGGPHAQRVWASARAFAEPQWLADQGFAVVVADGRGTPGRGTAWERAVHHDLAGVTLTDQVDALHAAADRFPDLDLSRVGITGWSYGGYLAALAVLARPDVFHVAVAGAPVTEWRLYDTCYTERYLGHPGEQPEAYDRNSLLPLAAGLERPLLLIHGLSDDNVVAAHTLQLSSALLAAGRPHTVLPLSGVTHMTPQEVVAENLKLLQVRFLREHLG
ncbi:MAG: prolyl oligopeptidase family serine peptidase [Aeromicrobium sp.]|uniref:S9 family peptidase n=1 Tax=Aeromicrobium sp. TaxID=1871063 RepID=UPI0039E4C86C